MVRFYSYLLYTLIGLFITFPSIHAQEQLTDFKGTPCCYEFEKIIPQGDTNYGIATDHQDGVRIYLLDKSESNIVFSNDQDDKISLIDHGLLEDFYYFIYQDRIELFRFSDGELEIYEFDQPLNLNRSRKEAASMSKFGLTLIPESETENLQFYNLATQRFETRLPSLNRESPRAQLDSFILFSTFEHGQGNLFSHNIVSDEIYFIHSRDNERIDLIPQNGLLLFGDQNDLFLTKGHPDNTFFLKTYRPSRTVEFLSYQKNKEAHIFINDFFFQFQYFHLDWSTGILEKYTVPEDENLSFVDQFYRLNEDELLLVEGTDFVKVNIRNDSVNTINMERAFDVNLDTANAFFNRSGNLTSFNYATEETTRLSDISLSTYIRPIQEIHKVNDSLFYLIGYKYSNDETNNGLFAFDLTTDTIIELLSFGENGNGLTEAKLEKVGQKLLLRRKYQILEWTGQQFEFLFNSSFELPIIQHQDKYYFISYANSSTVSLYEWQNQSQIVKVVDEIPYLGWKGRVLSTSDQLIFINNFYGAFEVDIETGTYSAFSPYNHDIMFYGAYQIGDYIIIDFENPGIGNEYWSYHSDSKSWTQLEKDAFDIGNNSLENPIQAGDYLLKEESDFPEEKLTSISMRTGERLVLLDRNNPGPNFRYYSVSTSCAESVLIHVLHTENDDQRLYVTDGTIDGTQLITDLDPHDYYSSFYKFEGYLYFTAFDDEYTKAFRLNCENQQLEELEEFGPLIPQQHFRLGNRTYALTHQFFPEQNLTLNQIIENEAQELLVSPYEVAPDNFSFFETPKSKPITYLSDSLLAISVSLDEKGKELWWIGLNNSLKRMTDLNQGPFDSEINNLITFGEYLYFTGYQYGTGMQVWRIPLPFTLQNENPKKLKLLIAPNPSEQFLTIYNVPKENGEVKIYDMSGKLIFEGTKSSGSPLFSQNMQQYPPGMYIVQLWVDGKLYSDKFILK